MEKTEVLRELCERLDYMERKLTNILSDFEVNLTYMEILTQKCCYLKDTSTHTYSTQSSAQDVTDWITTDDSSAERQISPNSTLVSFPVTYDGNSSWDLFFDQFEAFIDLNKVPLMDQSKYLLIALRGNALEALNELTSFERSQYGAIVRHLGRKYGNANREIKLARSILKIRQQKENENLQDFAEEIRKLAEYAYSNAPEELKEYLTIQAFIDGLMCTETKKSLILADHVLFRCALKEAVQIERSKQRSTKKHVEMSDVAVFADLPSEQRKYPTENIPM